MNKKEYTKEEINKAGKFLINPSSQISLEETILILSYFRSIHIPVLRVFRISLIRKIKKLNIQKTALLSQRLKRTPSIIQKLKIEKNMKLTQMQDIGGLRIVVENLKMLYKLKDLIRESEKQPAFKSEFINEKDYVKQPKESGYRSYHLIYKYSKNVEINEICKIEIQIRTKLHHAWATAIEVIGTYLRQPLKQSFGDKRLLELFKKISKAFVLIENNKKDELLFKEIKDEVMETKLIEKLEGFNIINKNIDKKNNKGAYFLIKLDFKEKRLKIINFTEKQLENANKEYVKLESENTNNKNIEVVLVSVKNITNLKKSYPNYFLDTNEFLKYLNKIFIS